MYYFWNHVGKMTKIERYRTNFAITTNIYIPTKLFDTQYLLSSTPATGYCSDCLQLILIEINKV